MKLYLFKILSVFLAVWMVTITGGLHLYGHECLCCDVQEVAMADIDMCCSEEVTEDICYQAEKEASSSCCEQTAITDLVEGTSCSTDDCCTVSHSYLKLDESFNTSTNILLKSFPVLSDLIQLIDKEDIVEKDFQVFTSINNSSPPGFTGKAFLIFTHTLKIPLSL